MAVAAASPQHRRQVAFGGPGATAAFFDDVSPQHRCQVAFSGPGSSAAALTAASPQHRRQVAFSGPGASAAYEETNSSIFFELGIAAPWCRAHAGRRRDAYSVQELKPQQVPLILDALLGWRQILVAIVTITGERRRERQARRTALLLAVLLGSGQPTFEGRRRHGWGPPAWRRCAALFSGCRAWSSARAACWRRSPFLQEVFDSTLGFPGEGPSAAKALSCLSICTLNVTEWSSWLRVMPVEADLGHIWLIQEHKVVDRKLIGQAKHKLRGMGWHSVFADGRITGKGGRSSGMAVIVRSTCDVLQELFINGTCSRAKGAVIAAGPLQLTVWSIYGDCFDSEASKQVLRDIINASPAGLSLIIGAPSASSRPRSRSGSRTSLTWDWPRPAALRAR